VSATSISATIARSADSLPALVGAGALVGAECDIDAVPPGWRHALAEARGICLPIVRGMRLADVAARLVAA